MARTDASGDQAARSSTAAALETIKPYVATVGGVALLGTPAEIAVPIARRLRRQSGVSVGPGVTNLVHGTVALGVVHLLRSRPAQWQGLEQRGIPPWAGIGGLVYLATSPVAAARWRRGVILHDRSPLWGALVSPVGLLPIALVLGALYRARRSWAPEVAGPSEVDAGTDRRAADL